MKTHFGFVLLAAGVLVAGCNKKPAPTVTEPPKQETANPVTAPVDYLGTVVNAGNVALKKIDVASITSAIQLFNAQEGRFPKDLNELVAQRYLGKIPATPAGTKLQYDAVKGEVSVVKE